MKKNYKLPRMRAVKIKESDMLCNTGAVKPMKVELNNYSTFEETKIDRTSSDAVDWTGEGTGSDF